MKGKGISGPKDLAGKKIGYAPGYLHIDGDWRDHKLFALTAEEVGGGLLRRLQQP